MNSCTYLVDGSGYIFRAFYAVQPLTTSAGLPTNALFGFTRMLLKLIRDVQACDIAVTFDSKGPTFRHERYADYKANRKECPPELVPQLPYFRKVVEALGIAGLEQAGVEADDIIATVAMKLASQGKRVVVVSGDKDLLQLVGGPIEVWDPMRGVQFSPELVKEKFGVPPELVRDYLALTGDSSDNVPGVKGIGPKTAERLLNHFGGIDQMLEKLPEIDTLAGLRGAKGIRERIESNSDTLRLSRELVTLETQVSPFNSLDSADRFRWHGARRELITPLFEELEFTAMMDAIPFGPAGDDAAGGDRSAVAGVAEAVDALTGLTQGTATDSLPAQASGRPQKIYTTVYSDTLEDLAAELRAVQHFAFDTETTSLDVLSCELVGLSVATARHRAWYVPVALPPREKKWTGELFDSAAPAGGADAGAVEPPAPLVTLDQLRSVLGPIFADRTILKSGVNLKFDIGVLEVNGFEVNGVHFDAMICSHVLNPDRRQHGLKALALQHLGEEMVTYEEMVGEYADAGLVPVDRIAPYACHDADASFGLAELMLPFLSPSVRIGTDALNPDAPPPATPRLLFDEIEMPLIPVLSRVERRGVKVDVGYLESLGEEFTQELRLLEQRVYECAGREFNLNSPKQLGQVLFEELKLSTTGVKKTQSGYSTDANVLSLLASRTEEPHHEIAVHLLEYRELHKLMSTYIDALKRLVHPRTGRIHTSFNQAVAATGRLSSSDPNLQNIPIRNARGRRIRRAFVAEPGSLLLAADYSQIELRVLAHLSGDEALQAAFRNDEDIHQRTAVELFGEAAMRDGADGLTPKDLRRAAKTINFGVIYGMSAFRLAGELGIPRKQAQQYIDGYFARYPRVLEYFNSLRARIETHGYVETLYGRRRNAAELETQGRDAGYTERSLLNAPLQGTAAEIIKRAMIELDSRLAPFGEAAKMVLQVHDELVFEIAESRYSEVEPLVREVMESAVVLDVPLKVELRCGTTWGE